MTVENIGVANIEIVNLRVLKPYPDNPRVGDVGAIMDSLKANSQYKPLIVQRSTGYVLAGNHSLQAMKKLKWKQAAVTYVDCDDEQAKRILLVDNRSSDIGSYDSELLARVLETLPNPIGTGYNDADVRAILAGVEERDATLVDKVIKPSHVAMPTEPEEWDFETKLDKLKDRHDNRFGEEGIQAIPTRYGEEGEEEAAGVATIQMDLEKYATIKWPSENYWGIPDLLPQMLLDELPDPLDTWAGEEVTPDDGVTSFLWTVGLAGTKGLPWDRTILSFATHDSNWYSWFDHPARKVAETLYNGCDRSIVPDTSFWIDDTRFHHLSAQYNAMWLARFMQQAGIRVIPRLMWADLESIKVGKLGIPPKPPIVMVAIQAISKKESETQMTSEGLRTFVKDLQPEALIVYGGGHARQVAEEAHLPKSLHVVHLENYAQKRRNVVFDLAVREAEAV